MTTKRRRIKQTLSLSERLHRFAEQAKDAARRLPQGDAKDQLMRKAEKSQQAAQLEGWLTSPRLRPPQT